MKVGDLVIRRNDAGQLELLGCGIVLSKTIAGKPKHPCVTVFYPKVGKSYSIAESLVEVINESG